MSIFYKTGAGQNAFTVEERVSDYIVEYPIGAAEPTAIVVSADFERTRANYARPNANALLAYNSQNVYFINDEGFQDKTGGVVRWRRTWASIPSAWSEPEEFAFTFPSYIVGISFGSTFNVTNISASGANVTLTTTATGISSGDDVYLDLAYTRNSQNYHMTFITPALIGTSAGSWVVVANKLHGSGNFTNVSGTVRKGNTGRSTPESLVVPSRVLHEYALSSETALDTDLPIVEKFAPVNSSGYEITALSTGTATVPNSAAYANMVSTGIEIVADRSQRQRYMGNIYCRLTRLVKAR